MVRMLGFAGFGFIVIGQNRMIPDSINPVNPVNPDNPD
jgi:hypothetical protein